MLGLIGIIVGLLLITIGIVSVWVKPEPGQALVITGFGQRVIVNSAGLCFRPFERVDRISLEAYNIEVTTTGALSSQGVPLNTTASVIVKIANHKNSILSAMENFEGSGERIQEIVNQELVGRLREVISDLTVEELYSSRDEFSKRILEIVTTKLSSMGLELKSLTIKDIQDDNGYIKALGAKEIARVKRDANIDVEEAHKEEAISVSKSRKQGEQAVIEAEAEISEARKAKALKEFEYQRQQEAARAESDAAYKIQENITKKQVTDTEMDAEIVRQQRLKELESEKIQIEIIKEEKNIQLAEKRAERKEQELQETIVKPAAAEKQKQELEAQAKKYNEISEAQAQAEQISLHATAEAERTRLQGQAEADSIKAKGEAEADSIRLKAIAEAEGLEKRADALAKLGKAGLVEMLVQVLPEMTKNIAEPMSQIDKIVIMDGGNGEGAGGPVAMAKYAASTLGVVIDSVKEITGIDIADVIKADTYDAKVTKNITVDVIDSKEKQASKETTNDVIGVAAPVTVANHEVVEKTLVGEAVMKDVLDPYLLDEN